MNPSTLVLSYMIGSGSQNFNLDLGILQIPSKHDMSDWNNELVSGNNSVTNRKMIDEILNMTQQICSDADVKVLK